jgi:hypothetical protein
MEYLIRHKPYGNYWVRHDKNRIEIIGSDISFVVACVFSAAGIYLPTRCRTKTTFSGSNISAFRGHVTFYEQVVREVTDKKCHLTSLIFYFQNKENKPEINILKFFA